MFRPAVLIAIGAAVLGGSPPVWAQSSKPMPTRDFVAAAAASDQYEISAARVAQIESRDPGVQAFAQQMIQDHIKTSATLRRASLASGLPAPAMIVSGGGQSFLATLQGLRGAEFDKAYVRQQVLAHREALVLEQGYAASGDDPNVKQAAQSAVPIIRHHLDMAQRLQAMP